MCAAMYRLPAICCVDRPASTVLLEAGAFARAGDVVENPGHLGAGEIGVLDDAVGERPVVALRERRLPSLGPGGRPGPGDRRFHPTDKPRARRGRDAADAEVDLDTATWDDQIDSLSQFLKWAESSHQRSFVLGHGPKAFKDGELWFDHTGMTALSDEEE